MNEVLMVKCPVCGRYKKFGKWIKTDDFEEQDFRALVKLMQNGQVSFQFVKCSFCTDPNPHFRITQDEA